jgi:hypothetical protein
MRHIGQILTAAGLVLTFAATAGAQAAGAVAKRAASGEKLSIALIPVDQTNRNEWTKALINAAFEDALLKAGRFRVLSRTELAAVKSEQILSTSGLIDPAKAVALGKGVAANYVIVVRQLALDETKSSNPVTSFTRGLGINVDRSTTTYNINLQAQVIDTETTEVVHSDSFNEVLQLSRTVINNQSMTTDPKITAPYRQAVDKFAGAFTTTIAATVPLDAVVAAVTGNRIAINGGAEVGLREGNEFDIIEEGDPIRVGGEIIGYDSKTVGRVRVTKVEPKLAWVQLVKTFDDSGKDDAAPNIAKIKVGMLARMAAQQ